MGTLVVALVVAGGTSAAEPPSSKLVARAAPPARESRPNAIYAEVFGKGGIWGLGYERSINHRVGVGGVGSFTVLDGERLYSLTPYVSVFPLRRRAHALFADAGVQLLRISRPSPIPEWDDTHDNGIGAEMSAGYEYRGRLLLRVYGQVVAGKRGLAPWTGASIGWTL